MRLWIGIQILLVLMFFALATVIWGPLTPLFLSVLIFPLVMFARVQHTIWTSGVAVTNDFRVVALFLAWCGLCFVVLPVGLQALFWQIKENLLGIQRNDAFWTFGRLTFIATGVALTWSGVFVFSKLRTRYAPVEKIRSNYFSALLRGILCVVDKPFKCTCITCLTIFLTLALAFCFGTLLFVFGGFSAAEIYEEPTVGLQYTMVGGGFLLTLILVYYLTLLWWPRASLTTSIVSDDGA